MYATIRRYKSKSPKGVLRQVKTGFVPIISKAPGFLDYYVLNAGDGVLVSISVFETQAEEKESNRMAAQWVKQTVAPLMAGPPEITEGEVIVHKTK
jgi:quinol monooxygenase YgiN